jgi:phosphomannomutase / phosphoglucomutase
MVCGYEMSIYKKCDIRGEFGVELTVTHAHRLGVALSLILPARSPIIIGGDGRVSTPVMQQVLIETLVSNGLAVTNLGMVSTPAFYFARRRLNIKVGVMVTASHNPATDNGFKVILGELPITPGEMEKIAILMEGFEEGRNIGGGSVKTYDILAEYSTELKNLAPQLEHLKVVVDCSNGMASQVAQSVWSGTGATATLISDRIDGRFPDHAPNPANSGNLRQLEDTVLATGADLGVCFDGDGDRVGFVNEMGQPIPNDKVIVMLALSALSRGPASIVYDQKCSRIVPDAIRAAGGTPILEQSGHTFIKKSFLTHHAPYAGEVTGHHFFDVIQGDDGMVAALFFCKLFLRSHKKASEWLQTIDEYPITPDIRIPIDSDKIDHLLARLEANLGQSAQIDHRDGLRFEFKDSWCLIRPSVTEPMVTARFEGISQIALKELIDRVCAIAPELAQALTSNQEMFKE